MGKSDIRKKILKKRDEITKDIRTAKNMLIKQRLFSSGEFANAKIVFLYASFRSEVETIAIIKESLEMGKRIVLPKVNRDIQKITLYEIEDIRELSPGQMGIPEPSYENESPLSLNDVDLIVVPGVAFDCSGSRLGYGGGYYDRLLAQRQKRIPVIALAYEEQLVDMIPSEPHDIRIDMIITDKRVIKP